MDTTTTSQVELLPKGGQFIITHEDGTKVKGRFSITALTRLMEEKKIDNYLDLANQITLGMSLKDYVDLILFAIQDYPNYDEAYDRKKIIKLIDEEWEGIKDERLWQLVKHAVGRGMGGKVEKKEESKNETEDQKKSEKSGSDLNTTNTGTDLKE